MQAKRIGVIGGSGLYEMEGLSNIEEIQVDTPFGSPSDSYIKGSIESDSGVLEFIFLPRHGRGHRISPSEINSRANIYGFKKLGVKALLSISAVGSMKDAIAPGELVLVDQFIDRTKLDRGHSFFGDGIVAHVPIADPVCPVMREILDKASDSVAKMHKKGTYICIEGPQFSTRAESNMYRVIGVDVIGMTACPEYKLAREAELHFSVIALSTDYDCWKEDEDHVTVDAVMATMRSNVDKAKNIIKNSVPLFLQNWDSLTNCSCEIALSNAIMTSKDKIPAKSYERLELLISKHVKPNEIEVKS